MISSACAIGFKTTVASVVSFDSVTPAACAAVTKSVLSSFFFFTFLSSSSLFSLSSLSLLEAGGVGNLISSPCTIGLKTTVASVVSFDSVTPTSSSSLSSPSLSLLETGGVGNLNSAACGGASC